MSTDKAKMSSCNKAKIDREMFEEKQATLALRVAPREVGGLMTKLKKFTVRGRGRRSVVDEKDGDSKTTKVIVLDPALVPSVEDLDKIVDPASREKAGAELIDWEVRNGYEHLTVEQVLRRLIPEDIKELPSSFETVGHLAHLNLREEVLPWRYEVGQVILDKNPVLRTVVTKVGSIENQFRTFPMEVIAGENSTEVEVKEYGCIFRFDFADVYWNSRLHEEHWRLVNRFNANEVLVDAFCGVGPFAIPAARKGLKVYASDLNPKSYAALVGNIAANKVEKLVTASNEDARAFIPRIVSTGVVPDHVVMNLPASGLEFLDAFRGAFDPDVFDGTATGVAMNDADNEPAAKRAKRSDDAKPLLPLVHCYCFSSAEDYKEDIVARAEQSLGCSLDRDAVEVRQVRDVAPRKMMYCLHFRVPAAAAFAKSE
ncbi:tRNA guanine37-N1-methyltransferase [Hondaea fermentalgiana]|uniref:tRNA (guanine(37)-N1)-methyltransferase n=1 Tax=Hondaea fermentalgiana TaxID=2315210 RepID=A0A2R5GF40_9STRA|nr:tRNA guanine37-N1-methyltransferase [Hondaea fermentalgiana]|eukprot:GBG28348.1 tRNA guanine37-N1-methyltransferase [Hondaea fermentalgiana]